MEKAGFQFEVIASPADEIHDESMAPERLCETNAELKAAAVAVDLPGAVVIGADTLVFIDDRALGKPKTMDEARGMLRRLSGRTHYVCTGVCVIATNGSREVFHDRTEVDFKDLDDAAIDAYFRVANPLDKAGAYGIQENGEMIVDRIRGSFENVMGFPVEKVAASLGRLVTGGAGTCGERVDGGVSVHGAAAPVSPHI